MSSGTLVSQATRPGWVAATASSQPMTSSCSASAPSVDVPAVSTARTSVRSSTRAIAPFSNASADTSANDALVAAENHGPAVTIAVASPSLRAVAGGAVVACWVGAAILPRELPPGAEGQTGPEPLDVGDDRRPVRGLLIPGEPARLAQLKALDHGLAPVELDAEAVQRLVTAVKAPLQLAQVDEPPALDPELLGDLAPRGDLEILAAL